MGIIPAIGRQVWDLMKPVRRVVEFRVSEDVYQRNMDLYVYFLPPKRTDL